MKFESGTKHTVKRSLPKNFTENDRELLAHELEKTIPATHILKLDNAVVLNDLIYKNFHFYTEYCLSYPMSRTEQLKRIFYFWNPGSNYDACIWISDDWSQGYFHWMTDALPRLLSCRKITSVKNVLLPDIYRQQEYIAASLKILGYTPVYFSGKCSIKELWIPAHTAPSGNYNESLIREARSLLRPSAVKKPFRKIYASRAKASLRRIQNEEELISLLQKFGFEIHYFEEYTLQEQMDLMSETQVLAGLHGAGLTNMLFMQENTVVLEFRDETDRISNCYFSLASALHHDYYYLLCHAAKDPVYKVLFTVDIPAAEKVLASFLSTNAG